MADLCIVTCGKKKIWDKNPNTGPTEAKNVYIGPLSKKGIKYAEKFYPDTWMILSAKHGFLDPKDIIPQNYDSSFNIKNSKTISLEELKIQIQNENLDEYEEFDNNNSEVLISAAEGLCHNKCMDIMIDLIIKILLQN